MTVLQYHIDLCFCSGVEYCCWSRSLNTGKLCKKSGTANLLVSSIHTFMKYHYVVRVLSARWRRWWVWLRIISPRLLGSTARVYLVNIDTNCRGYSGTWGGVSSLGGSVTNFNSQLWLGGTCCQNKYKMYMFHKTNLIRCIQYMVCITVLMTGYWHCETITHPLLPNLVQVNLIHKFCLEQWNYLSAFILFA